MQINSVSAEQDLFEITAKSSQFVGERPIGLSGEIMVWWFFMLGSPTGVPTWKVSK